MSNMRKPTLRRLTARLMATLRQQSGALLMETTVSLAVFGVIATAVLSGVQTSNIATDKFEQQAVADTIVRNQLESIFAEGYQAPGLSYTPYAPPANYTVSTQNLTWDTSTSDIAKIIVTVSFQGNPVQTIETIRVDR